MCETEILLLWGYKNPNFNLCSLFDQMVPDKLKLYHFVLYSTVPVAHCTMLAFSAASPCNSENNRASV